MPIVGEEQIGRNTRFEDMEIALSEAALGADPAVENVFNLAENFAFDVMSRRGPSFATSLSVNARTPRVSAEQLQRSQHYFNPAPILRFTVGKFSQLPVADGPEVVFLGRSNVGVCRCRRGAC